MNIDIDRMCLPENKACTKLCLAKRMHEFLQKTGVEYDNGENSCIMIL